MTDKLNDSAERDSTSKEDIVTLDEAGENAGVEDTPSNAPEEIAARERLRREPLHGSSCDPQLRGGEGGRAGVDLPVVFMPVMQATPAANFCIWQTDVYSSLRDLSRVLEGRDDPSGITHPMQMNCSAFFSLIGVCRAESPYFAPAGRQIQQIEKCLSWSKTRYPAAPDCRKRYILLSPDCIRDRRCIDPSADIVRPDILSHSGVGGVKESSRLAPEDQASGGGQNTSRFWIQPKRACSIRPNSRKHLKRVKYAQVAAC